MQYRELGRTGWKISTVSFGAWAIGGSWGPVDDAESLASLHRAGELGVNFFDTSDRYGDGRSERLLARFRREHDGEIFIATKIGRRLRPHLAEGYTFDNLSSFVDRSLANLDTEALDLVQLHCPPTEVYSMPETFDALDDLVSAGKVRHYGVSVEKIDEALTAIEHPNVQSVQIVFNLFRHRPAELFFRQARRRNVGIFARVPLASGLLTGKMTPDSTFDEADHRSYNREGASFDRGETFSGVDFELGLTAVDELRELCPPTMTLAQFALRWILMFPEVTCAIPGARRPDQVEQNVAAADLPALSDETMAEVRSIYDRLIRGSVHHCW
jgi:aryl-alcohol dehydrogenase-like predicted oxidoreductase